MVDQHKNQNLASRIVAKMLAQDAFSTWLGIEVLQVEPGKAVVRMKVRKDMLNGFQVCHGGVTFSLADSALAFASNSRGRISLAMEANISYPNAVKEGDLLTAVAEELSLNNRIAIYSVTVFGNHNLKVAVFRGTVYRTGKEFL